MIKNLVVTYDIFDFNYNWTDDITKLEDDLKKLKDIFDSNRLTIKWDRSDISPDHTNDKLHINIVFNELMDNKLSMDDLITIEDIVNDTEFNDSRYMLYIHERISKIIIFNHTEMEYSKLKDILSYDDDYNYCSSNFTIPYVPFLRTLRDNGDKNNIIEHILLKLDCIDKN